MLKRKYEMAHILCHDKATNRLLIDWGPQWKRNRFTMEPLQQVRSEEATGVQQELQSFLEEYPISLSMQPEESLSRVAHACYTQRLRTLEGPTSSDPAVALLLHLKHSNRRRTDRSHFHHMMRTLELE